MAFRELDFPAWLLAADIPPYIKSVAEGCKCYPKQVQTDMHAHEVLIRTWKSERTGFKTFLICGYVVLPFPAWNPHVVLAHLQSAYPETHFKVNRYR